MHVQIALLYTGDPRFQAHYDRDAEGLAAYIESAIAAKTRAHEGL